MSSRLTVDGSSERTFTYRCLDSSKNLVIGVQLQPENGKKFKGSTFEFAWQQKKFSLWEIAKYSCFCDANDRGHGDHPAEYIERFRTVDKDIRTKCLKDLKENGCYVYTYVDSDGWIPPSDKTPKTSSSAAPSSIAECVSHLPDSAADISDSAEGLQKTLARESNFRIMYVVAATVQDVDYVKRRLLEAKATSMMDYVGGEFKDGGPWRKLLNPERVKEHVLCTVKIFQGGSQQVTPGFSEEECESDEEEKGPFRSIRSMRIAKTVGHKLTTFSLIGFKNFRYSLENLNSEVLATIEEHLSNESHRLITADGLGMFSNPSLVPSQSSINNIGTKPAAALLPLYHFRLEIVSALGFEEDSLYCEYQVLAPKEWHCVHETMDAKGDTSWAKTEQGEEFLPGTTQIATSRLCQTNSSQRHPSEYELPLTFLLVLFVILVGLVMEAENACWIFGAILLTLSFLFHSNETTTNSSNYTSTAHFGVPLSFSLSTQNPYHVAARPILLFQVCSIDWLGRHRVEGYGYQKLEPKAGSFDNKVSTWLPMDPKSQLEDFFIGGGNRLKDLRFIATPPRTDTDTSHKRRFTSKFGFATQSEGCGNVRIRLHVIEQFPVDTIAQTQMKKSDHRYQRSDFAVASLGNLEGGTTAEKASTYIKQLQARRSRTFQELTRAEAPPLPAHQGSLDLLSPSLP